MGCDSHLNCLHGRGDVAELVLVRLLGLPERNLPLVAAAGEDRELVVARAGVIADVVSMALAALELGLQSIAPMTSPWACAPCSLMQHSLNDCRCASRSSL